MKKALLIAASISLVGILAAFLYFATGVSYTYPPIKEYAYSGTAKKLLSDLRMRIMTDTSNDFKINDTTGTATSGYAVYFTVKLKAGEYHLKCEEHRLFNTSKTRLWLIGAFNKTLNIGGYKRDDIGIKPLIDSLETNVLKHLNVK